MKNSRELLKRFYGYDTFREGQEEVIQNILARKDCLVIMPTGGGKSLCYQIPALIFEGITLVISPLISLMKDQVDGLVDMGIPATLLNSSVGASELIARVQGVIQGKYKIVYVAPERLDSDLFMDLVTQCVVSHVAIDEAHCVSQWGHDFRNSYLNIDAFIRKIPSRPVVSAFTATATAQVMKDMIHQLELEDPRLFQYGYDRKNLKFIVLKGVNKKQFVTDYIIKNKLESGIVYCSTRKETEQVYELLIKKGISTAIYHAGLTPANRKKQQERFLFEKINVIVATNAFGMGIDKSNVRYVIHYNMPENMEAYYQEAGRAGRDGEYSECILLFSPGDVQIRRFLIDQLEEKDSAYVSHRYEKLQQMTHYCHITSCLRKQILNYFGEVYPDYCGQCSNCSDERMKEDVTLDAMKVLSCVVRMKERFGVATVSEVLNGSQNKKIMQNHFQDLSTYGLLTQWRLADIKDFVNRLVADGFLEQSADEYPILRMTDTGWSVLRKEVVVMHHQMKTKEIVTQEPLFDQLRELRRNLASEAGLPPYTVFPDKSLREMASLMPTNLDSMMKINGVGELKYQKYGEQFIQSIKNYMLENSIEIQESSLSKEFAVQQRTSNQTKDKGLHSSIISAELFVRLGTIEQVANERGIKIRTVEDHLFEAYQRGYPINLQIFIPDEHKELIENAIKEVGISKLAPIKALCPPEVTYTAIKALIAIGAIGDV